MSTLGKGLESLIPPKSDASSEANASSAPKEETSHLAEQSQPQAETSEKKTELAPRTQSPSPAESRKESIFYIEVELIKPNPEQPRTEFDPERLKELARSIKEHGILQPIVVSKIETEKPGGGIEVSYQLIAGERRLRASKMVGLPRIPAIVRKTSNREKEKLELAIIENVQRENLNIIERAKAYSKLSKEFGLSQEEVAIRISKSREAVANLLRLLNLPEEIQTALGEGKISEGHARAILSMKSHENQMFLFKEILAKNASVRETEEIAKTIKANIRKDLGLAELKPEEKALRDRLEQSLGTKVDLKKKGDKGKIVIQFYSEEELTSLLNKITGERHSL